MSHGLYTTTSTALLAGLRDAGNDSLWALYVERYRPLVLGCCRRLGLPDADAEDVAQESLLTFATRYRRGAYDRRRGRLRDWLFGIARRTLRSHRRAALRRREMQPTESGDRTDYFARLADPAQLSQSWEEEWRAAVLRQCLEEARRHVEPKTIEAFELLAWRGWPAAKVASHLGLSENAVYIAKHRVLRRMRALLPRITEVW